MAVARFEVAEPVKRATQRAGGVDPLVILQVETDKGLAEHGHHAIHRRLQLGVTGTRVAIGGGVQPRMVHNQLTPGQAHRSNSVDVGEADRRFGQPVGQELPTPETELTDQRIEPVNVAIQRRLAGAELLRNPGQRQRIEAFPIGDVGGSVDDDVGRELYPVGVRCGLLRR